MTPLIRLLGLPDAEKQGRGLVHTPAEIAQQPDSWSGTRSIFQENLAELLPLLRRVQQEGWTTFLIGAGTSDYVGHSLAPLLRRSLAMEVQVTPSTDLLAAHEDLVLPGRKYLWVHFSRSGDSPEGVAVLERALSDMPHVHHLVVTCHAEGRMAKLAASSLHAHCVVLSDRVNDRGLAMTSSFTNMVLFGQMMCFAATGSDFEPVLAVMQEAAAYMLAQGSVTAETIAAQGVSRACYVGIGALAGAAKESALKLLELTAGRVHTFSETTLGLRHGPMSALAGDTILTAFVSGDPRRRRYDLDLLEEVRRKKAARFLVAVGERGTGADFHLDCALLRAVPDTCRPPVDVIFGQLLGLFASIENGLRPDAPSPDGIISRVVQPFTIHA